MPKSKILNSAGIGSAALLAGLPVLFTLGPVVATQGAFADEPTADVSESGTARVAVNPALAVSVNENINITATPTVGNTFVTTKAKVNVKNTGSGGGYHLIMTSNGGGDITNKTDSNKKVSTFSEYTKTGAEMRNASTSSWGWTLQDVTGTNTTPSVDNTADLLLTYNHMPADSGSWNAAGDGGKYAYLKNTTDYTNKTAGDDITIGYAFAIGPDIPAGTYEDTIVYTAVPNKDNRTIFEMTNMQDLAAYDSACYNTPTPTVAATEDATSLSAITGGAVGQVNADKIPTKSLKDTRNDEMYTVKKLADGHCWMTTSLKIEGMDIEPTKSNVTAAGFALPAATASTGTSNTATEAKVANDGVNSTYLYNWFAATAGTGTSTMVNESAPGDICPKGWQLPNASGDMSWNKLLRDGQGVYQIATSGNGYTNATVAWGSYDGIKTASANPLGLQLTGYFWDSKLQNTGGGVYWARTAYSSAGRAYSLSYGSGGVSPQGNNGKGIGFGVRCVSR